MIFYPILLFVFAFSFLFSATQKPSPSLITLLNHRESGILGRRPLEKTWLEKKIVIAELKSLVEKLHQGEEVSLENFVEAIPNYFWPTNGDYEHNDLMDIVPVAFKGHEQSVLRKELVEAFYNNCVYEQKPLLSHEFIPFLLIALVDAGLDVNCQIKDPYSPYYNVRPSIFINNDQDGAYTKALLKRGMDPHLDVLTIFPQRGAFHYARTLQVAQVLVQAKAAVPPDVLPNIMSDEFELVLIPFYVQKGANVNAQGEDSRAPLYEAILHNSRDKVILLLSLGARVDQKCYYGKTVLTLADEKYAGDNAYVWLKEAINNQSYLQEAYRLRSILLDNEMVDERSSP